MATCPKCGAKTDESDVFCRSCGASIPVKTDKPYKEETYVRERGECFGEVERPRKDYLGLVSFGIFLLIVGIIFIANPNLISQFSSWVEQMAKEKVVKRPPTELIFSATLFFGIIGTSDFLIAAIRFLTDKSKRRVLVDILSGIALILFAYLLHLYGNHAISWHVVLAAEAVACGMLIILYSGICYLFPKRFH